MMNIERLRQKATEQASQWAIERGVCGNVRFQMLYENALILLTAKECLSIVSEERGNPYRNLEDKGEYGIDACDQIDYKIKRYFDIK